MPRVRFTVNNLQKARTNMQDGKHADDKDLVELSGKFVPRNWVGRWESV